MTPDEQKATAWGRSKGLLGAKEVAQGGWLAQRIGNNSSLMDEFNKELSAFRNQSGAMPANIEPLHSAERQGLNTIINPGLLGGGGMVQGQQALKDIMADPTGAIAKYTNPQSTEMINRAGGYYDQAAANNTAGAREITSGEIDARLNPFISNVIDTSVNELNQSGERARAALLAKQRQRGSSSYGDTQSGIQLSDLTRDLLHAEGKIRAGYKYQGYNDARGAVQQDRGRQLQAGQNFAGLGTNATNTATSAQGISNAALNSAIGLPTKLFETGQIGTQVGFDVANQQVDAGRYVRDYNQNINDIISNDYLANQNYPRENIAATQSLLTPYQSTIQQAGQTQGTKSSKLGNALSIAGTAASIFSDKRLKQDIVLSGEKDGIKLYDFSYLGGETRYRGVMADEIEKDYPDAVSVADNGFMMVDYSKLPVNFEVVNG